MPSFNILSSDTPIYQNALLEASAGTGKTFAIEHLVVRLLLENDPQTGCPCRIHEILVITFTRAATRELKARIRGSIERAIGYFRYSSEITQIPGYLDVHLNAGVHERIQAQTRLEDALSCFDEAQVFTIHGFCAHLLREHMGSATSSVQDSPPQEALLAVITNFFRTEIQPNRCNHLQLRRVLGHFRGDIELLQQALAREVSKGLTIIPEPDYGDYLARFQATMRTLLERYEWKSALILEDFTKQIPTFKVIDGKKPEQLLPQIETFAHLFSQSAWSSDDFNQVLKDGLVLARMETKLRVPQGASISLHYPELRGILQSELLPIVEATMDPKRIFAWMAHELQGLTNRYMEEEETGGPDQLLKSALQACQEPTFQRMIQRKYRFALVDEFQDTDPVQWEIIQRLFLEGPLPKAYLVLVGDPKQSIYAFRQADIYTYLQAAQQFPKENRLALQVNYRSQAPLVAAINALFDTKNSPGLIALPRMNSSLAYPSVQPAPMATPHNFTDKLGAVHFFLLKTVRGRLRTWPGEDIEKRHLLPYVATELIRLKTQEGFAFKQMALLVRDRHQAHLAQQVLRQANIPAVTQRQGLLSESPALQILIEWLEAMCNPTDQSATRRALGGTLIGWSAEQIQELHDGAESASCQTAMEQMQQLRMTLHERGISAHLEELLGSRWDATTKSVLDRLLSQPDGIELYRDLQQITNLLIQHQSVTHCNANGLLAFLDRFPTLALHEDERLKIQQDPGVDAVRILTMHMSKGLEFHIVFALGLTKRTSADELLIPDPATSPPQLRVMEADSLGYRDYRREMDAEKVRQAYVAMTRAKYRLYIPVAIPLEGSQLSLGEASPLDLLLARLDQPLATDDELYARINRYDGTPLCTFIERNKDTLKISYQWLDGESATSLEKFATPAPPKLIEPSPPRFAQAISRAYSFTSLSRQLPQDEAMADSLVGAPHDLYAAVKNPHTLPAGKETGVMLHHLLETIAFEELAGAESGKSLVETVEKGLRGHSLIEWTDTLAEILYHAFHTPLPIGGPGALAPLSAVNSGHQYRELEFFYPTPPEFILEQAPTPGFLRGSIDLFFRHADRYYIIDWKTNWLGPQQDHYELSHLQTAIDHHHYDLQAQIYAQAAQKYLHIVDSRSFQECFGGVLYLFLRGLHANNTTPLGVYGVKP